MEPKILHNLLRCVQSNVERFSVNAALSAFVRDYRIGLQKGRSFYFTDADKAKIRCIIASEGVDPCTLSDAWNGLSRAEALRLGNNEKLTRMPVKQRRVAIKALRPVAPIYFGKKPVYLPAKCHLDLDRQEAGLFPDHDWIIVVENWECFNNIHIAADRLQFPGEKPVVVWRGDHSGTRADSMLTMIRSMSQPVAAFVDYDPAGMLIANSLPRLSAIVAPALDKLAVLLQDGLEDRYLEQAAVGQGKLDKTINPYVASVWKIIRQAGRAYPQEQFVRQSR